MGVVTVFILACSMPRAGRVVGGCVVVIRSVDVAYRNSTVVYLPDTKLTRRRNSHAAIKFYARMKFIRSLNTWSAVSCEFGELGVC